jgi:hypothetical protein
MNVTNLEIESVNNKYQCSYNFTDIDSINCTQLLLDIENQICNNITIIDKCIFQDNNNEVEEQEEPGYIILIIMLSIFLIPLMCCIYCNIKNDIYKCFANIFKSSFSFFKLCFKKCFYFLICNKGKEIDLELGIPGYAYNIKGCKMINCNDETNKDQECTICLTDLYSTKNEKNILSLGCNHKFHFECIDPWFRNKIDNYHTPNCPLCRKEINILKKVIKVSYQVDYDSDGSDFSFSDY